MAPAACWKLGPQARLPVEANSPLNAALAQFLPSDLACPSASEERNQTVPLGLSEVAGGRMLTRGQQPVCPVPDLSQLAPMLEKMVSSWILAFTPDHAVLHAALLRENGRVWLLPAERRAGKSTFCLLRALRGADYGGDDLVFLDLQRPVLRPFPKAVTLKQGSFPLAPEGLTTHADPVRGPIRYWHPPRRIAEEIPCEAISALVFPRFVPEAPETAETVSAPLAALSLVRQLFGGLDRDPRHLHWIDRLARRPAISLTYPDAASLHVLADRLREEGP